MSGRREMLDALAREIREINAANGWNVTTPDDLPPPGEIDDHAYLGRLAGMVESGTMHGRDAIRLAYRCAVHRYKVPAVLALIHSEVSEALEGFRANDLRNVREELADVVIRVLDLSGGIFPEDPGLADAIVDKLEKNRGRGRRHGGKVV